MPSRNPYRRDPDLAGFTLVTRPDARILVRRGYEAHLDAFLAPSEVRGGERVAGGRELHAVIPLPGAERAVVRRYLRGGAIRYVNRDLYFLGSRAFEEARLTEQAALGGVSVPSILAAIEQPGRFGYRAKLVTLWIAGARELAGWLESATPEQRSAATHAAGEEIGKMHACGVAHLDLNLRNFLVITPPNTNDIGIHIIDFDRGRDYEGPVPKARRERDLRRLHRSARKLGAPIDTAAWNELRNGYGGDWPFSGSLG